MADHVEVETNELQETLHELQEEREEREKEEKRDSWTKSVGLSTAVMAVFAALASLRSGQLVNEALIHQVKASDSWNEYQSARMKDHLFTLTTNSLLDANASNPEVASILTEPESEPAQKAESVKGEGGAKPAEAKPKPHFAPKSAAKRIQEYKSKINDELSKEADRSAAAKGLEKESKEELERHHKFEHSVTLIQVAVALGAVSALTKVKPIWFISLFAGAVGIGLFFWGFMS